MAVGDLIRQRDVRWDPRLIRAKGRIDDANGHDLVSDRLFKVPRIASPLGRMRPWLRRLSSSSGRAPGKGATDTLSLIQLLDQRHDAVTYGTLSTGRETVAVPFGHVVVLTGAGGLLPDGVPGEVQRDMEERIEARFGQNIDPIASVRVGSAATATLDGDEVAVYVGRGIFVPQDREQPVGRVLVGPSPDALDEPRILGERPAGIYRGQTALAFGSSHAVAPAMARLGLPEQVWFYAQGLTTPEPSAETGRSTRLIDVTPQSLHGFQHVEASPAADARFRFEFVHADPAAGWPETLFVEMTLDTRPSRLRREASTNTPSFEIAGFRVAAETPTSGLEAFWLDLDALERPIGSAMIPREASIVFDRRRCRRYSWLSYRYDAQPVAGFRIDPEPGGYAIRRVDHGPLGYLDAPASPAPAIFQADWWTTRGYHLDWLDFTGCVEDASGSRGFAEIHASQEPELMPSFGSAPNGEFTIGPLILRRAAGPTS